MKKIFAFIAFVFILLSFPRPTAAFDRNALFNNIRSSINTNYTYSITNIAINAGPTQIAGNSTSLPAYQQIAAIIAQINQLKKSFSR